MRRAAPLALALLLALGLAPAAVAHGPGMGTPSTAPAAAPTVPAAAPAPAAPAAADTTDSTRADRPLSAEGRWIVVLRDGTSVPAASRHAQRLGVTMDRSFHATFHGYSARLTGDQVAGLRADPGVAAVVPDEVISIAGQSVPRGVRRAGGRESRVARIDGKDQVAEGDGERVDADVAIVDTGIGDPALTPPSHEDLNIAGGYNCYDPTPDNGLPPNPDSWGDSNGHGTHVAGTVGALDNGIGVVGVAPGVRLWAVRILDPKGNGLLSWYVCGLDWIAAQKDPADPSRPLFEAVNMSVAKPGKDSPSCGLANADVMHQAICRVVAAGIPVVAAAGNNAFNAANLRPASYNEVITVSALADTDGRPGGFGGDLCYSWSSWDKDDTFADFSNYGHDVDLIASGKCTYSTLPGNTYGWVSGTSMAAPHVTGAIALYRASRPHRTPAEVKAALVAAGNQDWNTSTDPDSYHEPMLDVSHIVNLGDFTVDATPGTSRDAMATGRGASLDLPVEVVRAEDFPGEVDLGAVADAPLSVELAVTSLTGQDATMTAMAVTVPPATASGDYTITVTATDAADGSRVRASDYTVHVDSDVPVAVAPASLVMTSTRLTGSAVSVRQGWSDGTDAYGGITAYQGRWVVDGVTGATFTTLPASRSSTRTLTSGHTYALEVRARDAAGNWSPWARGDALSSRLSQDTSSTLVRSGPWTRYTRSSMSGGTTLHSRTKGASLERAFTGRGIAFVAPKGPRRGRATIWIDGANAGSVSLLAKTLTPRVVLFKRTWATVGPHTIKIVVAGTAGHPRVDVDTFIVIR